MDMLDGEGGVRDYNLERLIMLSDGVFAIALTLLALELRPPEHWDGSAAGLLDGMILPLTAFLISFMSIGFYWTGHRRSFKRFRKADGALTALNFVLLALVTLVPVGTRMIIGHGVKGDSVLLYAGLLCAIGVANAALWGYAAFVGRGIIDPAMPFGLRLVIFLILLLVPGTMGTLGVLAGSGGSPWLFVLMGVLWVGVAVIRRRVGKGYEG